MAYTILVVDDAEAIRQLFLVSLGQNGFRVLTAGSGIAGLQVLERFPVDAIIADVRMPGMSGMELIAIVRKKYPDILRIIMTGHASLETAIQAINEGEIYRFFTKPCNIADIVFSLRSGLEQRDRERERRRIESADGDRTATLSELEKQCPGITRIKRDEDGTVIIDLD